MLKKNRPERERRKYIRLNSVFPVQFQILTLDGKDSLSGCLQGFTNNVGKGGICLAVNNLIPSLAEPLKEARAKLSLNIQMPLAGKPVKATAQVAWIKGLAGCPNSYLIGLSYEKINPAQNNRLIHYARARKLIIPALLGIIIILGLGFSFNIFISTKLIRGNKALVRQLVSIVQKSSIAKQKIKRINKEKEDLQIKMQALDLQIGMAEAEIQKSARNKKELIGLLGRLNKEKGALQEELIVVQGSEDLITKDLLQLDKIKTTLEEANLEKMYQWLKVHQNPRTGLVASSEEKDTKSAAFTYDQALAVQAYTKFSDFQRARKVLNFFKKKAKRINGGFLTAYYAESGRPVQGPVQSGPNISLGIAIAQYGYKTNDSGYLDLAEEIAAGIIALQQKDKGGGIPGSENAGQYNTKDNLDAYAFFTMLNEITGKKEYAEVSAGVLNWLLQKVYDKNGVRAQTLKEAGVVGDSYALAIAAVGPGKLEDSGVNPDRIIEFAEANCTVKVCYIRPEGQTVNVTGFDFSQSKDAAGNGIITSEWTAQMVIVFKIMADYYYQQGMFAKARAYALRSGDFLSELDNMIISSPSPYGQGESCLPYSTQDVVDTPGGIRVLRGKSSGCVAGTVYALFAYYNYNPLALQD